MADRKRGAGAPLAGGPRAMGGAIDERAGARFAEPPSAPRGGPRHPPQRKPRPLGGLRRPRGARPLRRPAVAGPADPPPGPPPRLAAPRGGAAAPGSALRPRRGREVVVGG